MRIAHVIDAYDGQLLYQEGYLVREQLRRGHEVVVLARHVEHAESGPRFRVIGGNLPLLAIRLAKSLRRERPDVVHVHDVLTQISFSACIVKPLVGYRLVLDSHHSSLNTRVETRLRRVVAALYRMTVGRVIRHAADEVFAVAGPERTFTARLLGCDENRITVIPLGVDTDVFHPDADDRGVARARLGVETDFIVAHAGRLVPNKGLETLLDAASRIGATALLVGELDERLRPAIENARTAGTRVVLPGVLAKEELASALRAADTAVWMGLPSLSAVEAMAVGLPLVTLETPHFREQLGDDYPLFAADGEELVTALESLRSDAALSAEVGSRNADRAAESRAWTTIAEQVELLYA
jgi:glycosyltransferase involved in cell wall biosynthesis